MDKFINESQVIVGVNASSREDVLQILSDLAEKLGFANSSEDVLQAFFDREKEGPTGMQYGFAVPHAKCSAIIRPGVLLAKLIHPVEWPSFDNVPVDIALALLVPSSQAGTTHLKLLSKTAVMLMDKDIRRSLREKNSPKDLSDLISEKLDA